MTILEAIQERHSIRRYTDEPIPAGTRDLLQEEIDKCNAESGLHIQLVTDEPKAFGTSMLAHYGRFSGVRNYFALVGRKSDKFEELCGYYGERLVLLAQTLGLSTCWVALTYKKIDGAVVVGADEKLECVISVGYAAESPKLHKRKTYADVCPEQHPPQWFRDGVEAALQAPTAVNQQKFRIWLEDGEPRFKAGWGFYSKVDLGIVKYHFEIASGRKVQL